MNYVNLIKNKIQHIFDNLLNKLSTETKFTDDQMECMHFGICDYDPRQVEEVPFLHY